MLNAINLMGRLTKDPEIRYTSNEIPVARFSVACQRDKAEGKTDFFEVEAWRGTAEFAQKYFHEGDMVAISGRLQNDKWTDKDGHKRITTKIVANSIYFGESKRSAVNVSVTELDESDGNLPF